MLFLGFWFVLFLVGEVAYVFLEDLEEFLDGYFEELEE